MGGAGRRARAVLGEAALRASSAGARAPGGARRKAGVAAAGRPKAAGPGGAGLPVGPRRARAGLLGRRTEALASRAGGRPRPFGKFSVHGAPFLSLLFKWWSPRLVSRGGG